MLEFLFFILPFALSCIFGMSTLVLVKTRPKTPIVREPDDRDKLQLPENCTVFLARIFERRLVDAGIIKSEEMSVCTDIRCKDCAATRAIMDINRTTRTMKSVFADRHVMEKQFNKTMTYLPPNPGVIASATKKIRARHYADDYCTCPGCYEDVEKMDHEINVIDARTGVSGPRGAVYQKGGPLKFDQPQFDYIEKVGNEITKGRPTAKRRNNLGYG